MKGVTIFGRKPTHFLLTVVLVAACGTGYYYLNEANAKLKPILPPLAAQRNLQEWLETTHAELIGIEPLYHLGLVTDIYRRVDHKLLWLQNYELSPAGKALVQQLLESSADDLLNYNYHLSYLQQRLHNLPNRPKDATAVDILLTDAFISYAEDVLSNKLTTKYIAYAAKEKESQANGEGFRKVSLTVDAPHYEHEHAEHDHILSLVADNANPHKLSDLLSELQPQHHGYKQLQAGLQRYQDIAASGKWQPIDDGPTLKPGSEHPQIAQLRSSLELYRDYPIPKSNSFFSWLTSENETKTRDINFFDDGLVASLKHFQQRHGNKASGILDKETRALLNVTPDQRIKQLSYNMKRWRELPENLGERYIWVNMNDYRLDVFEKGRSIMDMKVVVGKTSRRTPVMMESISSLVLNPSWNVPRRIMIYDILPQLKKNPNYLSERNIRILDGWTDSNEIPEDQLDLATLSPKQFPYRLQQDPGPDNALGTVKFVIPNDYSIYLHDTNHRELFAEHYRALSSGCVRVEKPLELAEQLLRFNRGWDMKKIQQVVAAGETTYVRLEQDIPTYLLYWTAFVDDAGTVHFRDDIYSLEEVLKPKPKSDYFSL